MADRYSDRNFGRPYRAEDSRAPDQSSSQPADNDPLAELARLIGQTDPFANLGRGSRDAPAASAPRRAGLSDTQDHDTQNYDTQDQYARDQYASDQYASDQDHYASGHDAPDDTASAQDRSDHDISDDTTSDDDAPEHDVKPSRPSWMQRVARHDAPQSYEDPVQATKSPSERTSGAQSYREPSFQAREPSYRQPTSREQASREQTSREPSFNALPPAEAYPTAPQHPYEDPQYAAAHDHPHDAYGQQQVDPSRYDDALYGAADDGQPYDQHAVYPADAYAQQGYEEEAAERAKPKRGGMMTVVVVAALAVVGTAGAYGYRSWNGSPRSGEAPIIKADPGPNKVVPQAADSSSKPIQDRVATGPGAERIVSREEQPVDPNTVKTSPRVVFPALTQNPNPNPGGVAAPVMPAARQAANGAASGNLNGDEPRKVRTLAIRPDEAAAAAPAGRPPAAPASATRSPAPVTTATTPSANAPMSLSPQGAPAARTATNTPSNTPAASALASTGGGYVVQISSQRSEADAQASYRALQGKFPGVLGSRQPLIKRADLGEKGIYYRAMVGPFGSPDEASQFCGSLKTAGGQCVVQRN